MKSSRKASPRFSERPQPNFNGPQLANGRPLSAQAQVTVPGTLQAFPWRTECLVRVAWTGNRVPSPRVAR